MEIKVCAFLCLAALSCLAADRVPAYQSDSFVAGVTGRKTGFIHMEEIDGRWWAIDPLGRGFYFMGVQSANYCGVVDFLTQRCFYEESNRRQFASQKAWAEDCVGKLKTWGFNMLGHGCAPILEHRGLVHARELSMTQCLCRDSKDSDLSICLETTPACSAFPNVFNPGFEAHCRAFAQRHCAPHRDDPWVAGWYIDNELAWWGDAALHVQPRCEGLYETVARLPATHSARRALDKYLADRGVRVGERPSAEIRRGFLLLVADRYFSVTSRAIREADPNHMVLGARFAGIWGAVDPEVFAIAAKYSDVLTFNCYPWADLDTNEVFVERGGASVPQAFGEIYARARKPLLITEWSFPALDAGLPCSGGAGQRFATQALRAQASELWMRTLLALPYVAGWNYFRWVDQHGYGISRFNREDSNYGLVNERNEPYPLLVDAFTRLQRNVGELRRAGLPPRKVAPPGGDLQSVLDELRPCGKVSFRRDGDTFTIDAGVGFSCAGRVGGNRMLSEIRMGSRVIGSYGALLCHFVKARKVWAEVGRVTDVSWQELSDGRGALTVRAEGGDGAAKFAFTHRLTFLPGSSRFLCECLSLENTGTVPLALDRLYFRLHPAFPVDSKNVRNRTVPAWKLAHHAFWSSPTSGCLLGATTRAANVDTFRFYTDETGDAHPDMAFSAGDGRTLAPGQVFTPPQPMWILATAAASCAETAMPEPRLSPSQVDAIADRWEARRRAPAPAAKPSVRKASPSAAKPAKEMSKTLGLEGGVSVRLDDAGGFAFSCGGRTLSFAPFVCVAEPGGPVPRVSFRAEGDALVADVAGDERNFGSVSFGSCSARPSALYFGYGYYVANPGRFRLPLNGHQNAARFAGFEFTNGVALVVATETPPEALYHDPAKGAFGFCVAQPTRFTFVVGRRGAFDCALRYRAHFKVPAPAGFARKAGRFCVDSWNGTFNEFGEFIRRAADDYGLKDDLFFYAHCWQRYGFDRHLPEVYPPSPTFGTAAELKAASALARARGWNFGVHLNVIDCYPESPWFSWDRICHVREAKTGIWKPAKAWINPPFQEQSYRLLPKFGADSITYQMKQMLTGGFRPDTVFIDVTGSGSSGAATCRDAAGNVHSLIENTRENGRLFDAARSLCDGAGFVSSEAPCDYLVGHLDGGDCQWMHLTDEPGAYRWMRVPGDVQEKTPWFPLVYHDRIALHGVGYSARFEGARGEDCHGVDSDDYISCELMNGHALMADCYNRDAYKAEAGVLEHLDVTRCLRQTVRKYWLAQHIARELGTATVSRVSFEKGNPRHLRIVWSTGLQVCVNRDREDWPCETGDAGLGEVPLPQYGFVAFNAQTKRYAAIRRRGVRVVEESAYADGERVVRYVNARGADTAVNRLPVAPATELVSTGAVVRVRTTWRVLPGQTRPCGAYRVGYWLLDPQFREYSPKEAAVHVATVDTTLDVPTEVSFAWPKGLKGARVLHVAASPVDADVADAASRFKLLGTAAFYRRYRQGTFAANGAYAAYACPDENLWERLFPPSAPVDYGWIRTAEAMRVVSEPGKADVRTFLP